jgi:8-oxo-dGTP pyrophosphatase MutT (NUDIX family)
VRDTVAEALRLIEPYDDLEALHRRSALDWVASGAPLFRVAKPDVPPQHLVSYFAVISEANDVLLVDHRDAGLWLPAGGHVEPGETPAETVRREYHEELGGEAVFLRDAPFFISMGSTVGRSAGHIDVSLWYLLAGDPEMPLVFDAGEFESVRWFPLEALPTGRCDPHLGRFAMKLAHVGPRPGDDGRRRFGV